MSEPIDPATPPEPTPEQVRAYLQRWQTLGPKLQAIRDRELREIELEQRRRAAKPSPNDSTDLADPSEAVDAAAEPDPLRHGMVEMQRRLMRLALLEAYAPNCPGRFKRSDGPNDPQLPPGQPGP